MTFRPGGNEPLEHDPKKVVIFVLLASLIAALMRMCGGR